MAAANSVNFVLRYYQLKWLQRWWCWWWWCRSTRHCSRLCSQSAKSYARYAGMDSSSTTRSYKISGMTTLSVGYVTKWQTINLSAIEHHRMFVVLSLSVTYLLLFGAQKWKVSAHVVQSTYQKTFGWKHHASSLCHHKTPMASSSCQRCTTRQRRRTSYWRSWRTLTHGMCSRSLCCYLILLCCCFYVVFSLVI